MNYSRQGYTENNREKSSKELDVKFKRPTPRMWSAYALLA